MMMNKDVRPRIIQGGMGIGVSDWRLAGAVARLGQGGVVSGTAIEAVVTRRLQLGDPDGHVRRALSAFPDQAMCAAVLDRYFVPGGKDEAAPFRGVPMFGLQPSKGLQALSVVTTFVEVFLAKQLGPGGLIGVNYLRKIELPLLASIYGALLAGADFIIVGAGSPEGLPEAVSRLSRNEAAQLEVKVQYANAGDRHFMTFDPSKLWNLEPALRRPRFLAIVASVDLARRLARGDVEGPDGFIVEGPSAGGHNAPPRGPLRLDPDGQPLYGARDEVDLDELASLGRPFWLAGSQGTREALASAIAQGATGVQVGTPFAFCEESGLRRDLKEKILDDVRRGRARVRTDPRASPTGFPFKVVSFEGSLSEDAVYEERSRACDVGCLRAPYRSSQGTIGYRCPAEPEPTYEKKGGRLVNTGGRRCLCNALLANVGLGQIREDGLSEPPMVTAGDDLLNLHRFFRNGDTRYSASDVVEALLPGKPDHRRPPLEVPKVGHL